MKQFSCPAAVFLAWSVIASAGETIPSNIDHVQVDPYSRQFPDTLRVEVPSQHSGVPISGVAVRSVLTGRRRI
ncbi:MAG TPA: hypothetical protein DEB39_04485 [Planctomycetaceae bacterium]|nr:hypothetical protein [Planctomycetaceae bacterium]